MLKGAGAYIPILGDDYSNKLLATSPFAYYIGGEASGGTALDHSGNGYDGAYQGVTLGQPGIGDGNTCPYWDGTNDYMQPPAGFRTAFSGVAGTVLIWGKVPAWVAGTQVMCRVHADANNYIRLYQGGASLTCVYLAGGVSKFVVGGAGSTLDFFVVAVTWDKNAGATGEMKWHINGLQSGATQTGLGVWAGVPIAAQTVIGADNDTPISVFHGNLAQSAAWTRALTPAENASLAVV